MPLDYGMGYLLWWLTDSNTYIKTFIMTQREKNYIDNIIEVLETYDVDLSPEIEWLNSLKYGHLNITKRSEPRIRSSVETSTAYDGPEGVWDNR